MADQNALLEETATQNGQAVLSFPTVSALTPDDENYWNQDYDYAVADRKKLESLYEGTLKSFTPSQIVPGYIVSFDDREVIINIGFKSEGIVPISEFRDVPQLKAGDRVEVFIESVENRSGQLSISRKLAQSVRTWETIINAHDEDIVMEGIIKRRTKGGFVVDLAGIEAFLPGSQIDVKPIRDYDAYVGQRMEFKVVKINHQQHNVVISHKALIEKDLEAQKAEIINNLERGQILEGTVKNITNFGVFIDLGGVDGLLHITDISWGRISAPDEVLHLDQKINIVVLDFDDEKRRISLGYKQLQPHPWDNLPEDLAVGAKVQGRVVTIADYGIFIELLPGVEGLIHVSEMSWSQHPKTPSEMFKIGEEIQAVILTLDRDERKMSLGIKQLSEDPWARIAEKYPVGSRHRAVVRNITNYGLFVELEEGVDGLIHIQDLSWTKKINHPSEFIKKDEALDVIVLELDVDGRKLRLGHKQLQEDPWDTYEGVFPVESVHSGTITKFVEKGALVELPYGVEGFVHQKYLKPAAGADNLKEGDTAEFIVLEFSKEQKRILLAHLASYQEAQREREEEQAKKAAARKPKKDKNDGADDPEVDVTAVNQTVTNTLGDLGGLANLRAQLQENEAAPVAAEAATEAVAEAAAEEEAKAE